MRRTSDIIQFSHSLQVMFINCIDCNKNHSLDLFSIFFSNIDVVDTKKEAWEHFSKSKYDLIIIGLKVPEMTDGIELIEKIRGVSKDITLLVMASNLDQFVFTKLIELHIDGFIIKPVYIKQFSDIIHKTLEKLKNKEDLYQYRMSLERKVKEQVQQLREKDKILFQQSKLAAMGEMMDAVAHQWKQPINNIKMKADLLEFDFDDHLVDREYVLAFKEHIFQQVNHMTNTLHEFRSFFRPNKKQQEFDIRSMVEKTLFLIHDELLQNKIKVQINEKQGFSLLGIENEFIHLILNLINNAKDAFNERGVKERQIVITISQDFVFNKIEIQDNAGGILEDIIDDIFKANVTTKEEDKGTGIGLYMSSQIAAKYQGTLCVQNVNDGVKFIFSCKK